jgi:phage terminase large subunit-like protein
MERNYACDGLLAGDPVSWYEPEYKSLLENWTWFGKVLFPIIKRKSEVEHRIDLINGGLLEMWSLQDPDASRGRKYKWAVINEAAKVPKLEYSWNAVIRPTLMDLRGGAMFGSTPRGRNFFWDLYRRGEDPEQDEWASFLKTTYENPFIPHDELDNMKKSLPEIIYRQEILAEFIDDQGSVFRRVQEAARLQPLDNPLEGHNYIAGVDVAASVDFTVVTVMDAGTKEMVYMDRYNRVDYNVLIDRIDAVQKRWNCTTMKIENNSIGQPVIDNLVARGIGIIPFTTTSATKQTIIQNLQSAFENGEIAILNDPVLIGELLSYESKRNQSGSFSYSAPDGMHDDCVMSLAIAWDGVSNQPWTVY